MSDSTFDAYAGFDDAALGAMPTDAPEATVQTPAAEDAAAVVSTPEQSQEQPVTPSEGEQGEAFNPEGPGDHAKAFASYRQQIAQEAKAHAETQARLQQFEAYHAQLRAEQQQVELQAQFEQYADDPESAAAFLETKQREYQQQAQADQAMYRVTASAQAFAATVPDFGEQVHKLAAVFGGMDALNQMASQQDMPAQWAYQVAQSIRTPEQYAADVDAAVNARLAELAPRAQPKTPLSSRGIGNLPAAAPNVAHHPAEESYRALNFGPGTASFDAAYDNLLRAAGG